jgi:hypothetical protein
MRRQGSSSSGRDQDVCGASPRLSSTLARLTTENLRKRRRAPLSTCDIVESKRLGRSVRRFNGPDRRPAFGPFVSAAPADIEQPQRVQQPWSGARTDQGHLGTVGTTRRDTSDADRKLPSIGDSQVPRRPADPDQGLAVSPAARKRSAVREDCPRCEPRKSSAKAGGP